MDDSWAIRLSGGRLDLEVNGLPLVHLQGLRPEVLFRRSGRAERWAADLIACGGRTFEGRAGDGLELRLDVEPRADALVLHLTLRNAGSRAIRLSRLAPLAIDTSGSCVIGSGADRWSVFRQGYQSWTGTRSFRSDEVDRDPMIAPLFRIGLVDIERPAPARAGHLRSDTFTAIRNLRSGEVVVLGFLDCRRAFGEIEVRVEAGRCTRLAAWLEYDGMVLEPRAEIVAAPLWIGVGTQLPPALDEYLSAAGARGKARVPERNPVGWCSWYYYFTHVSEERVVENLDALVRLRGSFACEYVQVDDGYQSAIGDWLTPNAKFPHGMGWLAQRIRSEGFDAGIWTAPFIARSGSRLLAEHPDWFVKNGRGKPRFALWNPLWGVWGACYALDTTHPDALEWLRQTFRTISREWGYRVLKLDFLFAAALPGRRHDAGATRAGALRRGLEAIREAAGDDAFLLGCGCPFGPAVGVVDAMRIGPDVAPFWSNALSRIAQRDLHGLATKNAIRNVLTRADLHRRWWLNDPDCLMVRDTKTKLTSEEVRSLATAIAITDGMIVLSDRIEQLSDRSLAVLDRTMRLAGGRVEVVDLMEADMPETVVSRKPEQVAVAAFNFDDAPQRRCLDLEALGLPCPEGDEVAEWWTGAKVAVAEGKVDLGEIPPHGCRVVVIPSGKNENAGVGAEAKVRVP